MSKFKEILSRAPMLLYLAMISFIAVIVIYLQYRCDAPNRYETEYQDAVHNLPWFDEQDNSIKNIANLSDLDSDNHYIYTILPDNLSENSELCFRDKHVLFSAYVGEECVFEQNLPRSRFYTNSVGANWVIIPLKQEYAGQRLYLYYELCYDEHGAGFDYMMLGPESAYLIHVMREKTISFILPFIYLIIGIILIVLDIAISKYMQEKHNLFYLGCLAAGVACYCLSETQLFQIFIANQKLMHLMPMLFMAVIPIPAVLYSDSLFGFKSRITAPLFTLISFSLFVVLTVLNFLDIADYHNTMSFFLLMILIAINLMFYVIIRYIVITLKAKKKIATHIRFTIIGLLVATGCGIIDIVRFFLRMNQDPAKFTRVGFLLYLMFYSIASSRQIIDAFKTSMKTELISRLAYEDGLTGLKNRTSYNEALDEIRQENTDVGIVMLDVNNLKFVNDNEGHDAGDEMLVYSSRIIRDAFGKKGMECYRIGGDEFVALVQTDHIKEDCEEGMLRLEELYREFNETTDCRFKIVIAAGYQVYDSETEETPDDVIKAADTLMYEQKRRLKQKKLG